MRLVSVGAAMEVCSLSLWERVGERGYGLSKSNAPSPDLLCKSTSPRWGEVSCAANKSDSTAIVAL